MAKIYPTTAWTVVRKVGTDSPEGRAALETICERYHPPTVRYLLRRRFDEATAKDIAQDFFAQILQSPALREPSTIKGSFGGYLRTSLDNMLRTRARNQSRKRRGGEAEHRSIDANPGLLEHDALAHDILFDRLCIRHQFVLGVQILEEKHRKAGKTKRWEALKPFLEDRGDYEVACRELEMEVESVRMAVSRLKADFWEILVAFSGDVDQDGEGEAEAWRWLAVLDGGG